MSGRAYIENIDMVFPQFGNTLTLTLRPKSPEDFRAIQAACIRKANNRHGFALNLIEISACEPEPPPENVRPTPLPEAAMTGTPLPALEVDEECPVCGERRSRHTRVRDYCPFEEKEKEMFRCPKPTI